MKASRDLVEFVEELRREAAVVKRSRREVYQAELVDFGLFSKLKAGCLLLVMRLGPYGEVWKKMLSADSNKASSCDRIAATLDAISDALSKGRLVTIEEAVSAEVLGDLVEHAEELIRSKYFLAAAVILRAILEERLRKLCDSNGLMPTTSKPTIENFKQALYAGKIIDKIGMKDIDWMAGVGNSAAHRLPEYKDEDVPPLYQRVTAFLTRFSVSVS